MSNERLWAPWRMDYIMSVDKVNECIFCSAARSDNELLLHRNDLIVVLLNRYPYTTGHLMVSPVRHSAHLSDLSAAEAHALIEAVQQCERILNKEYHPQGLNIGINEGMCSGAGIPGHIHVHLVPRWVGDTNFMPVVGEVRVIPESLSQTVERLRPHFL